jgi:hypothetical protein
MALALSVELALTDDPARLSPGHSPLGATTLKLPQDLERRLERLAAHACKIPARAHDRGVDT